MRLQFIKEQQQQQSEGGVGFEWKSSFDYKASLMSAFWRKQN